MSLQPITDSLSRPTATANRWEQVQNLVTLSNDLTKYRSEYRVNPAVGIGFRFAGLQTYFLKEQLLKSDEVQSALTAADAAEPLALRLSHPDNLSLITRSAEIQIELSDYSQILAGELLNRLYMPRGVTIMQLRASWAFRTVLLPVPERTPTA